MNLLTVLLQVTAALPTDSTSTTVVAVASNQSYFSLLLKGGWVLLPLLNVG